MISGISKEGMRPLLFKLVEIIKLERSNREELEKDTHVIASGYSEEIETPDH